MNRNGNAKGSAVTVPLAATVDRPGTPAHRASRCQRVRRNGRQCEKPARRGWTVCGSHGAGYQKREETGARLPAGGERKQLQVALAHHKEADQEWAARSGEYRGNKAALYDLDGHLADVRALADVLSSRVRASTTRDGVEMPPALLAALREVTATLEAISRIQARMRSYEAVPVERVRLYVAKVVEVLERFVPARQLDAALRAFEEIDRPKAPIEDDAS